MAASVTSVGLSSGIEAVEVRAPVELSERRTEELVIALVGAVGSGVSTTGKQIAKTLAAEYRYDLREIRLSKLINANAHRVGRKPVGSDDPARIENLQASGSALRQKFGNSVIAGYAVEQIHAARGGADRAENVRRCSIIDSLKHPDEARLLRDVYGACLWLVGVFAPEDVRLKRLEDTNPDRSYIEKIRQTDLDEGVASGQSVGDVLHHADYFLRNDQNNMVNLSAALSRFLSLIFGMGVLTPTRHESAMLSAEGQASRSTCLSRQVGAVIVNEEGEQIGQGFNDVPKYQGGLYSAKDQAQDHRCYLWKGKICHNDANKTRIVDIVATALPSSKPDEVRAALASSPVKGLIEFSRAVHAEMEAILSVARGGQKGIVGASLYSTTFPCHSCARHIVASGITDVFYIEPYPKSLALKLHDDAISTSLADQGKKVLFLQYEGVAPRSFTRIFGQRMERKIDGHIIERPKLAAKPLESPPMDDLASREQIVVGKFKRLEAVDG